MIQNHLSLLRLKRDFKAGLWTEELRQQAWAHWNSCPSNHALMLLINIQHSLRGFSNVDATQLIEQASEHCEKLSSRNQLRLAALAMEQQVDFDVRLTAKGPLAAYPLLAQQCSSTDTQNPNSQAVQQLDSALLNLTNTLTERLQDWDDYARFLRSKSIAVVGNAKTGLGKKQGQQIDQADTVIRFNRVNAQTQFTEDYGLKTDLWVISPSFRPDPASLAAKTLIVSGVNPFHKPSQYWQSLARLPIERILTFPPRIWYRLVRQLDAPPTAGLLTLASLKESLDDCTKVQAVGFTECLDQESANHYGDSGKRSSRHNWEREAPLVQELIASLQNANSENFGNAVSEPQAASQKSS